MTTVSCSASVCVEGVRVSLDIAGGSHTSVYDHMYM